MYILKSSKATTQKTFFWNMTGSISNAVNTLLMTMVITRFCGATTAGLYALALAVAEMLGPITTFQIRNYQASDIKSNFNFTDYFITRIVTTFIAFSIAIGWIFFHGYSVEKAIFIILCTIFKLVEAFEDVLGGHLQLHEHLDVAGKIFSFRVIIDTILFILLLYFTSNLFLSYTIYIIFAILWTIFITYPYANAYIHHKHLNIKQVALLIKDCLPICITQFLIAYIMSSPKYALDKYYSSEYQTYFAAIFMPASVVNLFTSVVYRIYITNMAIQWSNNKRAEFNRKIIGIIGIIFIIGIFSIICGWVLGIPVLSWFYALPELNAYKKDLIIILIGGTFSAITNWLGTIFTIIRKQQTMLYINIFTFVLSLVFINPLVKELGMMGATLSYMILMMIIALIQLITYFIIEKG